MNRISSFAFFALLLPIVAAAQSATDASSLPDRALQPPRVTADFDPDAKKDARRAQGVPAMERTANVDGTIDHQIRAADDPRRFMQVSKRGYKI